MVDELLGRGRVLDRDCGYRRRRRWTLRDGAVFVVVASVHGLMVILIGVQRWTCRWPRRQLTRVAVFYAPLQECKL